MFFSRNIKSSRKKKMERQAHIPNFIIVFSRMGTMRIRVCLCTLVGGRTSQPPPSASICALALSSPFIPSTLLTLSQMRTMFVNSILTSRVI